MIRFLKRRSIDLTRRNSKGEEQHSTQEKGDGKEGKGSSNSNASIKEEGIEDENDKNKVGNSGNENTKEIDGKEKEVVEGEGDKDKDKDKDKDGDGDKGEEISEEILDPCKGLSFSVGVSENRNSKYRRTMEDVHTYVANFCERLDWGYFGVFDGHAGKQTARWAGTNLHNLLYDSITNDKFTDLRENLNSSFLEADKAISQLKDVGSSGCTAAVAVLRWEEEVEEGEEVEEYNQDEKKNKNEPFDFIPSKKHRRILYTANVGDSRIVLCRKGKAKRLSYEHKGSDKNEIKRIYKNGGLVLGGRVNGVLAVTRSLGDVYLKEFVLGTPFTTMTELNEDDKFIIIACDGLWDVCSDQEAVNLIKNEEDAKAASEKLCSYAMSQGTSDNVTVMVVKLDTRIYGYQGV